MTQTPNRPDHSGMLISPAVGLLVSTLFFGLVVYKAQQLAETGTMTHVTSTRASSQLVGELAEGAARTLGVTGALGLGAVVILVMAAWFGVTYRKYKALQAADEQAARA